MPVSGNISTTSVKACTIPVGSKGIVIANDSASKIYYGFNRVVSAAADANKGLPLDIDMQRTIEFPGGALQQDWTLHAILASGGPVVLTYEILS